LTRLKILFILSLLLLVSCRVQKKEEAAEEKREDAKGYEYCVFVSSDSYSLLDCNLQSAGREEFPDTIKGSAVYEGRLFLLSSGVRTVSFSSPKNQTYSRCANPPTSGELIANRQGVIYISGQNLVFKDKTKEQFLLSCDSRIMDVYENPYHSYIYCTDSLGYLYAIDFETKTLKRRFFIGKIKSFSFAKYGTRVLAVTDKSFLVLDYETLNVIFEKRDFFTQALSYPTKDLMFLYSGIDRKCWIYSNIDYKKKTDFTTKENDILLETASDSLMLLFSKSQKTLTLFNREKKVSRRKVGADGDVSLLLFTPGMVVMKSDSLVFSYDIRSDSVKKAGYFRNLINAHSIVLEKEAGAREEKKREAQERAVYSIQIYALSNEKYAQNMADKI